ncbi:diguanylate cyclase (GGDEF) domain-containing protein [Malonomonas rubra DSM 5091]|uniref:diguanylate cyclase n=1 Tax=Malonomonas rubra DSM 5091 TaxID=1122189 RepID=A0A1M6LAX9_MALRU|nr:GGDEF domain-containing protein [Malonomonas rubra]SHJ68289.1 diguanylate cyclase (GGDEF) domain-containing protein [Malonomonas rubra DSM 5091]
MMHATALVIGADPGKKLQLVKNLSETKLFDRVKPLKTISALFQHLKTKSADIICWAIDSKETQTDWIYRLQKEDQWHDLPLIAFADNQQSLIKGFNLGASDSIRLSADPCELNARLQGHLKRWQRMLDLRKTKEQLQKMALTDPLTELGNRATFDLSIKQATARTQRSGFPVSLLMIDLDHFKQFNDTYGHQAGDNVLRKVAKAIRTSARDSDICCRYGGEEFAIILPDTDANNAKVLADRIHREVAQVSDRMHQFQHQITVSIGISCATLKGTTHPKTLVEEADRALYQAKSNGRNRTETWHLHQHISNRCDYRYSPVQQLAFGT